MYPNWKREAHKGGGADLPQTSALPPLAKPPCIQAQHPRALTLKRSLQLFTAPNTQSRFHIQGQVSRTGYFTSILPFPFCPVSPIWILRSQEQDYLAVYSCTDLYYHLGKSFVNIAAFGPHAFLPGSPHATCNYSEKW